HTPACKPVKLAALALSQGMLFQERAPVLWGQFFGQNSDRDSEGQTLAYDYDYRGFVGGYERDYNGGRMGLLAGVARADTDSDMLAQDTDSVFVGVYGHAYLGKVNLTASLLGGLEDHDTKRQVLDNINDYETAKSDRDSYFLSPSITLSSGYALKPEVELRPSATLTYTVGHYDGYKETGTTHANLDVDSRTVDAFAARLQLECAKMIEGGEMNLRMGAQSRHTGGDDITGDLGGANFRYGATSDSDVTGGFVGGGIRQQLKANFNVVADLEYGRFSGDEEYLAGQVTLEYRF
ncbi:MAG: autotransporter outer membrane beta-barrel domain-containing protein, partial [Sedimenticolaceae bacterium]